MKPFVDDERCNVNKSKAICEIMKLVDGKITPFGNPKNSQLEISLGCTKPRRNTHFGNQNFINATYEVNKITSFIFN